MADTVISDLHPGIVYNYKMGVFYRLQPQENVNQQVYRTLPNGLNLVKGRLLTPNIDGFLNYKCPVGMKAIKLKAIRVAYEMFYNTKRPIGMIVYPKDMIESNLKINNIGLISVDLWATVKDAHFNITGGIKIKPHKENAYSFVVHYRKNSRPVQKTVHDITQALLLKRKIIVESYKIATKYTVTH